MTRMALGSHRNNVYEGEPAYADLPNQLVYAARMARPACLKDWQVALIVLAICALSGVLIYKCVVTTRRLCCYDFNRNRPANETVFAPAIIGIVSVDRPPRESELSYSCSISYIDNDFTPTPKG